MWPIEEKKGKKRAVAKGNWFGREGFFWFP